MNVFAAELPPICKVGAVIRIKATVLQQETFKIKAIEGKWLHLINATDESRDHGWWNADQMLQIVTGDDGT